MSDEIPQSSFTSGELAPALHGRVDFARYYQSFKRGINMIVRQYGGVINRPGSYLVDECFNSTWRGRLIPFEFSAEQSYVLEFTHLKLRIIKDGGLVVYPVGDIQAGTVVEVTTPYNVADLDRLKFAQSLDVLTIAHPNYKTQELIRRDHHLWSMQNYVAAEGPFQELNVDTGVKVTASNVDGYITLTSNTDIFVADHVGMLFYIEQPPDGITKKWEVQKAIPLNEIRRAGSHYYRAISTGTTGTVRPTTLEGNEYDGDPGVTWEYLHSGYGIAEITGITTAKIATATVKRRIPETVVNGTFEQVITGVTSGLVGPPAVFVKITIAGHGFLEGATVDIADVAVGVDGSWPIVDVTQNTFKLSGCTVAGIVYVAGGTASRALVASPSYKWAFGAWGADQGYPGAVGYEQERMVFGGSASAPHTFWMSWTKGYKDFGKSVPILDDDAMTYKINSNKLVEVRHFLELSEFIAMTSSGPFLIRGGQDGVIKPGSISRKKQPAGGCSHLEPIVINSHAVYVQEKGTQVRSLGYSLQEDAFVGQDMTALSHHFFLGKKIVSWCYQAEPFACIWAILDDGTRLSLTYMPEQEVIGWARHETDGFYESCCCITESGIDRVYFQVRRTINGQVKRFIERDAVRLITDPVEAFFVDCGLTYRGAPAIEISGLNHLEGKTVAILSDGNVEPEKVVTGGKITLERAGSVVHIGLPMVSELQTLAISAAQGGIRSKLKQINYVSLIVEQTRGLKTGTGENDLIEPKREAYETYNDTLLETSGLVSVRVPCRWERSSSIVVRQSYPLPLSILAIIPEVQLGGV